MNFPGSQRVHSSDEGLPFASPLATRGEDKTGTSEGAQSVRWRMVYKYNMSFRTDGTPCEVKASRTVWSGGKAGDNIKGLPIAIIVEVSTAAEFDTALKNGGNIKVLADIGDGSTYSTGGTIDKLVSILNDSNVTINGSLLIETSASGTMTIGDSTNTLTITGDLTVNAPNATVINNANVTGTVNIVDVSSSTWVQNGDANKVIFADNNGGTFDYKSGNITNGIEISSDNPTAPIVLKSTTGSTLPSVTITGIGSKVEVDSGTTISNLTVDATATGATITNNGNITVFTDNAGDATVDGSGQILSGENSINIDVEFGSIVINMESIKILGQSKSYSEIASLLNMTASNVQISDENPSEGNPTINVDLQTLDGAADIDINETAGTITLTGNPGLYGTGDGAFSGSGTFAGFVPYKHDTVTLTLQASDGSWAISDSATIPYMFTTTSQNGKDLDINVNNNYDLNITGTYSGVDLKAVTYSDFATAMNNMANFKAVGDKHSQGDGLIKAFCIGDLTNVDTLTATLSAQDKVTLHATKASGDTVATVIVFFLIDTENGTIQYEEIALTGSSGTTDVNIVSTTDTTPPTIIAAKSFDTNQDGRVDAVQFEFSEPVFDDSINPADFSFSDDNFNTWDSGTAVNTSRIDGTIDDDVDDEFVTIEFAPNNVKTTGTIKYKYSASAQPMSDLALNGLADITTAVAATDNAAPVMIAVDVTKAGATFAAGDTVAIKFSEKVTYTPSGTTLAEQLADFNAILGTISTGVFSFADSGDGDTFPGTPTDGSTDTITFTANGGNDGIIGTVTNDITIDGNSTGADTTLIKDANNNTAIAPAVSVTHQ